MIQRIIIGTAGHVDHGKSALAKILTGVDPDRLPEEKAREMTIELGFVFFPISANEEAAIIDVPGHERFLKTMIAAAHSIRIVLFVVAADEGVMPQTVEQLNVLKLMNIEQGFIVITKIDKVDGYALDLVKKQIRTLVEGSFLGTAQIFCVSCLTYQGIQELKHALQKTVQQLNMLPDNGIFRCPIDRVFTMRGFGTIVAGTVISGSLNKSNTVEVLPIKKTSRIRSLQVHNAIVPEVHAGQRVAFNLPDIPVAALYRGCELSVPDYLTPTTSINVRLNMLAESPKSLKNNDRVRFHKGTCEVMARTVILGKSEIAPGQSGMVHFQLEKPIVGEYQERYMIRSYSPMRVIGGGRILEVNASKRRSKDNVSYTEYLCSLENSQDDRLVEVVLRNLGNPVISIDELVKKTNIIGKRLAGYLQLLIDMKIIVRLKDNSIIHRNLLESKKSESITAIVQHAMTNPLSYFMNISKLSKILGISSQAFIDKLVEELKDEHKIEVNKMGIRMVGANTKLPAQVQKYMGLIEDFARKRDFKLIKLSDVKILLSISDEAKVREIMEYLTKKGILVEIVRNGYLHRENLQIAQARLIEYLKEKRTIRAAEYKLLLGVARDTARDILDYFFDNRLTVREQGTHRLKNDIDRSP